MLNFMDRMTQVSKEVALVKQSLTQHNPLAPGFDPRLTREGYKPLDMGGSRPSPKFQRAVIECAKLIKGTLEGRVPDYYLREAMSTSDFPNIFGDLLYRQMLGNYVAWENTYPKWCRIVDVKDFRKLHMYALEGGDETLGSSIPEYGPYPETKFIETPYFLQVAKYGRRYGISWEMTIQDDMNAFANRPQAMALGARRSEEYLATQMLVDVNGPHAAFFTSGNANLVTGNPSLGWDGLQTAWQTLVKQKDNQGNPIRITAVQLVCCPADEVTANNMLNTTMIRMAERGASSNELGYVNNWMTAKISLSVNPYIPIIATSAAHNPWFLIANPNEQTSRPAFVFGFLRGYRNPAMWVKDPDAIPLGGGAVSPTDGSFDNDSIDYKLRHVFGAAQIDPKMAVASFGS